MSAIFTCSFNQILTILVGGSDWKFIKRKLEVTISKELALIVERRPNGRGKLLLILRLLQSELSKNNGVDGKM